MTEERKEILALGARCRNLDSKLKRQRWCTDKMREAVAAYLAGEATRKRLERVFNATDYSDGVIE